MVAVVIAKNNFIIKTREMKKVNWKKVKEKAINVGEWLVIFAICLVLLACAAIQFGLIKIGA